MERIELEAEKREIIGKKVRFLRREGVTPANLYGHGVESVPLQVNTKQLETMLAHMSMTDLIHLKMQGAKTPKNVMVRQIQKNPTSDDVLHVDFYQVKMTEKIKADVPLVFIGEAPVLKRKNVSLLHLLDILHIEALPDHYQEMIQLRYFKHQPASKISEITKVSLEAVRKRLQRARAQLLDCLRRKRVVMEVNT